MSRTKLALLAILYVTIAFLCGSALAVSALAAEKPAVPQTVVDGLSYPEGGWLAQDGAVWFVEYGAHRVKRLAPAGDAQPAPTPEIFWESEGCGPAAVLGLGDGTVLVTCYDRNELVQLGPTARVIDSWTTDEEGTLIVGPNDLSGDGRGGAWLTVSGKFDVAAPATGALFFLSREGALTKVAGGLRYANGVAYDLARGMLYVGEMLENRIWRAAVEAPGRLAQPLSVFADLKVVAPRADTHGGYLGPDGMKVDDDGRLYAAQYSAGRVLILSTLGMLDGELTGAPAFVTNVTLTKTAVYATAATDTDRAPYPGRLVRWLRTPAASLGE